MPLRKLWNALRGQTPSQSATVADGATEHLPHESVQANASVRSGTGSQPQVQANPHKAVKSKHAAAGTESTAKAVAKKPAAASSRGAKTGRGLLGLGRGPHDPLCRAIKKSGATSVLEISVGDGTRAVEVVQTLAKATPGTPIRYTAIDQFELAGGEISLMQFHRDLRQHGIRPQIFPSDIISGVTRVAYTLGAVDLILIAENAASDSPTPAQWEKLLSRVAHPGTLVLRQTGDAWTRVDVPHQHRTSDQRKAA
tara:strand:- start:392217 stop:392978 length:762 start_codon:yes stop_codon:yes gene_type:complete